MEGEGVLRERRKSLGAEEVLGIGLVFPKRCGCDRGPGRGYGLDHGADTLTNRKIRAAVLKSLFTATSSRPWPLAPRWQEAQERETTRREGGLGAAAQGMRRAGASLHPYSWTGASLHNHSWAVPQGWPHAPPCLLVLPLPALF